MIYEEILHDELKNGMPDDIIAKGKATFDKRLEKLIGKNILALCHLIRVLWLCMNGRQLLKN